MTHNLRHWASHFPDRVAIRIGTESLTYSVLESQANQLAHVFEKLGLVRGDHVVAFLPNTPFMFVVAWAAYRSGLYFTPASSFLSAQDAAYIVTNSQARLVFANPAVKTPVAELPGQCGGTIHWVSHEGELPGCSPVQAMMAPMSKLPRDTECPGALMLYTSGTTGAPKGVWRPLPAANYQGAPTFAADLIALFSLDERVRYLSTAPLYHAAPLRFALTITATGGTVLGLPKFDAQEALEMLAVERITHSQWVPTMLQRVLRLPEEVRRKFRAPDHVMALHSAAPCPVPVKRAIIDWWGPILMEYYSGTEGVGLTMLGSPEWLKHPGSVGKTCKGVPHVLDDDWTELPAGETGRIFFSGVTPFQYFGDAEKTANRTSPQGYQTLGDIGYVDSEGYMYLTDRMDDMIISGGVNIYPQEIESAIMELPCIIDAGVVGMADDEFGERPIAFVVGDGKQLQHEVEAAVSAHCSMRLGRIKAPARYVVLEQMPRSPTGKLMRRELRDMLRSMFPAQAVRGLP
ncbi:MULTISPECIES: AMP-binding protein [Polaromonas]|uniref:AMP-binding protein n=1 Tax=Polaromonas aquatica TaxID=332657 RepID=A0ABW1U1Z2_9BURK